MATALTKTAIEALIARARGQKGPQLELIDDREPGLRIRAGERSVSWSLSVRLKNGQRTRITLGAWPGMGIADARKAAQDARRKIDEGGDPNAEKREAARRAEQAAKSRRTLADVLDQYEREKLANLRRGDAVRRALDGKKGLLRELVRQEPASITKADIADAVKKHAKTSPIAANRALAYARAFFNWCLHEDIVSANPAGTLKKPAKENSRSRHHTIDELAEIWEAAGTLGYPFGPMYRLLMVLPMRREEIAGLPVAELDLGAEPAVWTLPAERTKNGQALRVPLSPLARSIIAEALADEARPTEGVDDKGGTKPNPYLFSTTGFSPVSGFAKGKRRLDAAIAEARAKAAEASGGEPEPMPDWVIHDLRTSFVTMACRTLKVPANVADRCLNHVATATTSKIARIYNQDDLFDERRAAMDAWANFIETTVLGDKPENVVPFARAEVA
ncbi:tyrosine-type recombinase/integrase [Sphingobium ummariense]|uniref:Integrase n=1 Tax=Sphingobium ummariense RL-3 TaxID=1346791 RepID=T0IMX6_9SPHN|nr:site-specific integrase [Sphingobium ummariense]EQB30140.1 hypothetical protein M529_21450 [Sphingobium ummariense RL-3]